MWHSYEDDTKILKTIYPNILFVNLEMSNVDKDQQRRKKSPNGLEQNEITILTFL